MKKNEPTKSRKLKRARQSLCPYCGAWNCGYSDTQFDAGYVSQRAYCPDCKAEWFEEYKMIDVIRNEL